MTENTIPDWAVPGTEVVCISVNPAWEAIPMINVPVIGGTYRLRALDYSDGLPVCLLIEIPDQKVMEEGDLRAVCFGLHRFRPVKKLEEDVALFKELLQPSDERLGVLLDDLNKAWEKETAS